MQTISRKTAQSLGLNRYYTGQPCKRGHLAERTTCNWRCVVCEQTYREEHRIEATKYSNQYRKDNTNKIKTTKTEWRKNNPKKWKEYNAKFRENNPEYHKQYRKDNPGIIIAAKLRRRVAEKQARPSWYESEQILILYRKRDELAELWDVDLQVDHVIPLRGVDVCGLHCWENLQIIEAKLNQIKSNKFEE